jgi:hypothetical protein
MRQLGIELTDEGIEAFLLLQAVGAVAAETRQKAWPKTCLSSLGSAEFSDPNARLCV